MRAARGWATASTTFFALALHLVVYRLALGAALLERMTLERLALFGWREQLPLVRLLGAGVRDLPLVFALGAAVALASRAGRSLPDGWRWAGRAALLLLLAFVGLTSAANLRMLLELGAGLDLPALHEASALLGGDVDDFVSAWDLALALSPVVFFLLFEQLGRRLPAGSARLGRRVLVAGVAVLAAAAPGRGALDRAVRDHPIPILVQQLIASRGRATEELEPLARHPRGLEGFVDPALVVTPPEARAAAATAAAGRPTSILLFVLESVGSARAWPPGPDGDPPMPYLRQLGEEGWLLAEHRATSNSSGSAAFGLFTGYYDAIGASMSATSSRLRVPAMWSRIGIPDAFLVTPARLDGYFPIGLVRNDGLRDIVDFFSLGSAARRPHPEAARNELDGVDALVERLARTRGRPFFGTYWADAAHAPYFDHDPAARWIAEPMHDLDRYLNCLRVVDEALRRAVDALRAAGHGEDTLLVVVADHGEGFGEHGHFAHGRSSWEEILQVPALLWQPSWLAPRVDHRVTSHVDLLPTLLDALGKRYEPLELQGESLFGDALRRRYVFASGREGVVVSWSRERRKLVWSWIDGSCTSFDLERDPGERQPAGCAADDAQLLATKRFHQSQVGLLGRLSERTARLALPGRAR